MQEQTVKGNSFWLEGVELDLRELPFLDFAPTIDAGLGLLSFTTIQAAQEFVGIFARGSSAVGRTREGLDGVAAPQFAPVGIEEIAGPEDAAPGHVSPVTPH